MEIYLIRHPPTVAPVGLCVGRTDVAAQPLALAAVPGWKAQLGIQLNDPVFSSPQQRCRLAAEQLASRVITDDRLREVNFGQWEEKLWSDIPLAELEPWMADFVHQAPPAGESLRQLADRVEAFWQELAFLAAERIYLIAHGGSIRALLCVATLTPLEKAFDWKIDCGHYSRLTGDFAAGWQADIRNQPLAASAEQAV